MEEINIRDFFKFILKNIVIIFIVSLGISIITFVYSKYIKVPLYETYTTLLLTKSTDSTTNSGTIDQNDISLNQKLVSTYSELIKSKRVLNQVIDDLELNYKVNDLAKLITVESVQNTEILKISVRNEDAALAGIIANKIASVFSNEVVEIYKINNISIIDEATTPKAVANNTSTKDMIFAFMFGVFLMIIVLFIIYYFDDTIKVSDTLEEEIKMPIIGKIGLNIYDKKHINDRTELIVSKFPKSMVSEGIKTLRTNLQFSSVDKSLKSILITSSIPGEGKSFISTNLATAFAQTGRNVLIVDCDMRKGRQHKIFNVSNLKGLSNLLIDDFRNTYLSYIKNTEVKNLFLLTSGTIPPNPSELLNSDKNKALTNLLISKFDIVIFDGVPCNGLPDSIIMSTLVDKTLIVSAEGITPKSLLENTRKSLESVNSNIAGLVINKVNMKDNKYYGKYYSYYGEEK